MLYVPAPYTALQLYDGTMCAVGEKIIKEHMQGIHALQWTSQGTFHYMLKTALYKPCTGSRDTNTDAVASKYVVII